MNLLLIQFAKEQDRYASDKLKLLQEFYSSLSSPLDTFFEEEFIFHPETSFFYITFAQQSVGFVILNEEKQELYSFFLVVSFISNYNAQSPVFDKICEHFQIKTSLLYSVDIQLLNLLLDVQLEIQCHGYAPFVYQLNSTQSIEAVDSRFNQYELFTIENTLQNQSILSEIIKDEEFFLNEQEMIVMLQKQLLFYFTTNNRNTIVGVGIFQPSTIQENVWSIGMCIKKEFRQQGLGTLLLLKLQHYCISNNKIAASGCSARNPISRKTIEKSSGVLQGRVLHVTIRK